MFILIFSDGRQAKKYDTLREAISAYFENHGQSPAVVFFCWQGTKHPNAKEQRVFICNLTPNLGVDLGAVPRKYIPGHHWPTEERFERIVLYPDSRIPV